ncbi:oxygen-insensitive NADPH nitroreductase [Paenibacillus sp. FJAT-27812]|uniref:oxygen-insensitive NADPH nitroreductase n=1 Tax=Paenibacillus sp. FJAT-27812 TaxID=1684143 RepID=UPI0006A7B664|nr:oxygen-insensitive NADPH nitroreductase [Paenibacillus sp. FJAT-27812]
MNDTIKMLLNHRSIRSYKDESLTDEQIHHIVQSAQSAATSSYVQAYTIIGVKDASKKEKLAELAGNQAYVAKNGHFFVFCLDLHRLELAAELEGAAAEQIEQALNSTEMFMIGVIDTALAAQNAVIAAESMGLGICYIGGLRNQLDEVSKLLQTPNRVVPLFGLSVGYPANLSDTKPRLPLANVYHEDGYNQDQSELVDQLQAYDQVISSYYSERTGGARKDRWSEAMAKLLQNPKRLYMKRFLNDKNIPLE